MTNTNDIKFVFFGTPTRAVTTLEILKENGFLPQLIVTQPDSKKGRGYITQKSEVKTWAEINEIKVLDPEQLSLDFKDLLLQESWDLFVVVAYGKLLPNWLLEIPKHGAINIHYSLLPLYRGATPVETQILNGARETGVSIMLIDEKMDHGPIISQEVISMPDPLPTNNELVEVLSALGGSLLSETIPEWVAGNIEAQPQEHQYATLTKKFNKKEAEINLEANPNLNFRKIQAFNTWPRAHFFANGKDGKSIRIVITKAHLEDGKLILEKVIPEGKKEVEWGDFKRGLG